MVARTHAQSSNVTTLGKELAVLLSRLCDEIEIFKDINFCAKLSGEAGSFQALYAVSPKLDRIDLTDLFITKLGLVPVHVTTQIRNFRYLRLVKRKDPRKIIE